MDTNDVIALGISVVFLLSVIPIVGGLVHVRRDRLLAHAERMKALELGASLPDDVATARLKAGMGQAADAEDRTRGPLAGKCFSTAFWVAFWGFAAAAGLGGAADNTGVAYAIASSAGAIGVTAMICGTILALRPTPTPKNSGIYGKTTNYDADALDVASCRG